MRTWIALTATTPKRWSVYVNGQLARDIRIFVGNAYNVDYEDYH
jgi:plasmid maintenance system killer protein